MPRFGGSQKNVRQVFWPRGRYIRYSPIASYHTLSRVTFNRGVPAIQPLHDAPQTTIVPDSPSRKALGGAVFRAHGPPAFHAALAGQDWRF